MRQSNRPDEAWCGEHVSRSASEPVLASLRKGEAASLPDWMKPENRRGRNEQEHPLSFPGWERMARVDRTAEEPGRPGGAGAGKRADRALEVAEAVGIRFPSATPPDSTLAGVRRRLVRMSGRGIPDAA